jgi:hypothetical protein
MRKLFTFVLGGLLCVNLSGQTYSENFDSYSVGDYIGVVSSEWTTWSGTTGGQEDAQITDAQSSSTPNSIYFTSTAADGGPQDAVLPFGGEHVDGLFTFEASFYVEEGKGGYFNFQAEETIGNKWALDCYMVNGGKMVFVSDSKTVFETTYTPNTWFDLKIDINLSLNKWKCYVDDELQGMWANPVNQVASIDIFPVNPSSQGGNGLCSFYVDNVSYTIAEYVLPDVDGAVIDVLAGTGLLGQEKNAKAVIKNIGNNPISSFDVSLVYAGEQVSSTTIETDLASLKELVLEFTTPIIYAEGDNDCTVEISNINGAGADEDPDNDVKTVSLKTITPAEGKIVLGEEATGTWCGWCVRGHVFMDYMAETYHGYWAGIAVHNGDPMVNSTYDEGIKTLIGGYPSALVNRGADIDPSAMEAAFFEEITKAPAGVIENGAEYNEADRSLEISASIEWKMDILKAYKLACVIIEDSVTGTDSGYDQKNYYAGGNYGEMAGYENLPNPVPAADMVYMNVAREILPAFEGGSINGIYGAVAGETKVVNFSTVLDEDWDIDQLKIAVILINEDGKVDNAGYSTLAEAIENGFVLDESTDIDLTFNFDISCIKDQVDWFNPESGSLYVTGSFSEWATAGEEGSVLLSDEDGDMVYTGTVRVEGNQTIQYKYFSGTTAEWEGDPNREVAVDYENIAVTDVDTSHCATGVFNEIFSAVNIYPNPFNETVNVTGLNGIKTVALSNVLGQRVNTVNTSNALEINISTAELKEGIYFITLVDGDNHTYTKKIVKQ